MTAQREIERVAAERAQLLASTPKTMVMREMDSPRETFVHMRGLYDQADKNRPVTRAVPKALGSLPADAPRNRLGLAQWLVSDANPITARVVVNRVWEQFFGNGIVRTSDDFGLQGEWPANPELLDTLAVRFRARESCWRPAAPTPSAPRPCRPHTWRQPGRAGRNARSCG
jgi:hypothetical protein